MTPAAPTREEIAELARQTAADWLARDLQGPVPQNPFPALSPAAKDFDIALRRYVEEGECA